jgi:hypothetical protein
MKSAGQSASDFGRAWRCTIYLLAVMDWYLGAGSQVPKDSFRRPLLLATVEPRMRCASRWHCRCVISKGILVYSRDLYVVAAIGDSSIPYLWRTSEVEVQHDVPNLRCARVYLQTLGALWKTLEDYANIACKFSGMRVVS